MDAVHAFVRLPLPTSALSSVGCRCVIRSQSVNYINVINGFIIDLY